MRLKNKIITNLPILTEIAWIIILIIMFIIASHRINMNRYDNALVAPRYSTQIPESLIEITTEKVDDIDYEKVLTKRMELLDKITDKKTYYKEYWNIVNSYSDIYDTPERLEDYYTESEIRLIERVVETEVHGGDFDSKCNVASVIFNRIEGDNKFGDSVREVIKPGQFCYTRTKINDDTALAVRYAYEIKDTTNGCLFFHSNPKTNTFSGADYVFTDNVGHHFYK